MRSILGCSLKKHNCILVAFAIFICMAFLISNSIAMAVWGNYFVDCVKSDGELPCTNANDVIIDSFAITDSGGNPVSCVSCDDGTATAYLRINFHKNAASARYNVFAVFWVDTNDNGVYDSGEEYNVCLDNRLTYNNPRYVVIPVSWPCGKDLVIRGDRDPSKEQGPRVTWDVDDDMDTCFQWECHPPGKWNCPGSAYVVTTPCTAIAPDFSICQGTTLTQQLFIDNGARCAGEGCTFGLDYSDVNSQVPGNYQYSVSCAKYRCPAPSVSYGTVTILPNPTITITCDPSTCEINCTVPSIKLTADTSGSACTVTKYLWYKDDVIIGGADYDNLTVSDAATYKVRVECDNGCNDTATKTITADEGTPTVTITCDPSTCEINCTVPSVKLTADTIDSGCPITKYQWYKDDVAIGSAIYDNLTVNDAATYKVRVECDNGCNNTDTKTVSADIGNLTVTIVCDPSTCEINCTVPSVKLTADTSGSECTVTKYLWYKNNVEISGADYDNLTVSDAATYKVRVECDNGCNDTATKIVSANIGEPIVSITCDPSTCEINCTVPSVKLTADTSGSDCTVTKYQWYKDDLSVGGAIYDSLTVYDNATYKVRVECDNGCNASTEKIVTKDTEVPDVNAGDDLDVCIDENPFALTDNTVSPTGGTWSGPGVSSGQFNPAVAGEGIHTIRYNYTNPVNSCNNSDTRAITVVSPCQATAPDFIICQGTLVNDELFISKGAGCSDGCELTIIRDVGLDGTNTGIFGYTVICSNGTCPDVRANGNVTVLAACVPTAPNFDICEGTPLNEQLFLDKGVKCTGDECGDPVLDYSGVNNGTAGIYTYNVTCSNEICEDNTATGTVTVVEPPICPPTKAIETCIKAEVILPPPLELGGTKELGDSINSLNSDPLPIPINKWSASGGTFLSPTDASSVKWRAPTGPGSYVVTLTRSNPPCEECSVSYSIQVDPCPAILVNKTVSPSSGKPGEIVTFSINVTNSGRSLLDPVKMIDTLPGGLSFISPASPAESSFVKNPDETTTITWNNVGPLASGAWKEIEFDAKIDEGGVGVNGLPVIITGLSSEPLFVMSNGIPSSLGDIIEALTWAKTRLEIEMQKMRELREAFDLDQAQLEVEERVIEGETYTFYNYTNPSTGEFLSREEDGDKNVIRSEYYNLENDAILTTEYSTFGVTQSDSLRSLEAMENLRIDYNTPSAGYKTYTVSDYNTGDTLILVYDPNDVEVSREYQKRPGIPKEMMVKVTNCVTATGTYVTETGTATVSADDCAPVEIRYISDIDLVKTPDPLIATVNDTITYSYLVTNIGDTTLSNITLFDDKLGGITLDETALKPGESTNGTATHVVDLADFPGPLVNNATVTGTDPFGNDVSDFADPAVVLYISEIGVIKTADPLEVAVGKDVTYDYLITNVGNTVLSNIVLNDDKLGLIDLNKTALNPGESASAQFVYTVVPDDLPGPLENVAVVNGTDPYEHNVTDTDDAVVKILSEFNITKTALKKSVKFGEDITYVINVTISDDSTDILDVFDRDVTVVSVTPSPNKKGTNWQLWNDMASGDNITLVVKAPKAQDVELFFSQGVQGEGFVNVANDYSTEQYYYLKNCVYNSTISEKDCSLDKYKGKHLEPGDISADCYNIADCELVNVGEPGTELETREHGSGVYDSEEIVELLTENKSIEMNKDVSAVYKPTTLGLYNNRTVTYDSKWSEKARARNKVTGATMHERYNYANMIDRESYMKMDENGSMMAVDVEFDGMGHIGFLKLSDPNETSRDTPLYQATEDYTGSFRVYERTDEYGSSVKSEKSASGTGFVVVDKRVTDSQRTYEAGTGSYESDEIIQTPTNYIAKDLNLSYQPYSYSPTDDFSIDQSLKWKEGIWSKTKNASSGESLSLISERIRDADYIQTEVIADGLSEMESESDFSGTARYQAIVKDKVDMDETYVGQYDITRRVMIRGVPKYDRPHLTVTKEGGVLDRGSSLLNYTINVVNDGNTPLRYLHVRDTFPHGTEYLSSSVRPAALTGSYVNWSMLSLPIGEELTINLLLNVTDHSGGSLINRVDVTAYDNDQNVTISSSDFVATEMEWLTCCTSDMFASKIGRVDPEMPNLVWYELKLENLANSTMAAQIVDQLPEGMTFLGSSVTPVSFDGNEGLSTWVFTNIAPGEMKTIEYVVEVQSSGRYVNRASIEAYVEEGSTLQPRYVNSVVEVGEFEGEKLPTSLWQPPDWDFKYTGYPTDLTCDEICLMTS